MRIEPHNIFESRFQNRIAELSRVTQEAVQFIEARGVGEQASYIANLAIEEMVTNTLKYGYDDTAVHQILLRIEVHHAAVVLVIEDDGHEFDPLKAAEPDLNTPTEQRAPGGLGIHLVRKLAERLEYQRCDGRNRLTVRIRF
ncbi:MAG: ATP-binding protein [Verrucomicrobia bacterium]|nr:ATP-binding protein [Verrucomicrobiota bacterium]